MDLTDTDTRERMLDKHPIIMKQYTIITPMIHDAYSMIREMVWLRHTGLFMYASPRMGKSSCALAVMELLAAEFPDKYAAYHIADSNRLASFTRDLVVSLKLIKKERESYSLMIEKIILHVRSQLSKVGGNHFVLIIDEMQQLTLENYDTLLTIHNRLTAEGISMTTVGFAQPAILKRRSLIITMKVPNLVARFLSEAIQFDGCLSSECFMNILFQFDHEKEYPVDSGWSYTRFFLPKAFAAGFRLSTQHEHIWHLLGIRVGESFMPTVPLEHIFRIVEALLVYGRKHDGIEFSLSDDAINSALDRSRIDEYMELIKGIEFE